MNPAEEIRKAKQNIISVHDVLEHLVQKYNMTDKEAADYLIIKLFPHRQAIIDKGKYPSNPSFFGKKSGLSSLQKVQGIDNNLYKLLTDIIDEKIYDFDDIPF